MAQASPVAGRSGRWHVLLSTGIVMLGTLLSRVLGLAREMIFARQFGTMPEYGAFGATFSILDALYIVIIGGALGSALIPVFSRLMEHEQEERAWELANTVLTTSFVVFTGAAVLVAVFARPLLAATVASGPDYTQNPELLDLAVHLLRLMIVQPLLLGIGGLMMALLQSFERFTLPAIAFNVYNLAIIGAALFLSPRFAEPTAQIEALGWGVVIGALLYLVVQVPGVIRAGLRIRPSLHWRMPEVRRVGSLLAPRLFGQAAVQLNIIMMITFIGLLGASEQAAFRYGYQLLMLPHGIIAVSLGTVMFPRLTRLFATDQIDHVRDMSARTLRLALWLTVPAALMLAALYVPILRLLFQGGNFGADSFSLTSQVLVLIAPGAIGLAGSEIIVRTFYAMEDTRTPVIVGVLAIIFNGLFAWGLLQRFPNVGVISLSYSVTNLARLAVLFVLLALRLPGFLNRQLLRSLLAMTVGSIALLITVALANATLGQYIPGFLFIDEFVWRRDAPFVAVGLIVIGLLGLGSYIVVGALMRAPEIGEFWTLLRRRRATT